MPPQLFDLDTDPQETRDLAWEPGYHGLVADCEAALRRVVDPEPADALAKADQRARIAAMGGRADHCPQQFRLFAYAGHHAGIQLICSVPRNQDGQPRRVA
jgi:hypothetical protein